MEKFTLVINSGRSGSTYLYKILEKNFSHLAYIAHEDMPARISLPRKYNRAYDETSIKEILKDPQIADYLHKWQDELKSKSVIETGWTARHLAPVLLYVFKEKFQYIILHRHPMEVAASRATMGAYHERSFFKGFNELSPLDPKSIYPQKKAAWNKMNRFEKSLYNWYAAYSEAFEFQEKYPDVPCLEITSKSLFERESISSIIDFLGFNSSTDIQTDVDKNPATKRLQESFPLEEEWRDYKKHQDIIDFAGNLGYEFHDNKLEKKMSKYKLPKGVLPWFRYHTKFWFYRTAIKRRLLRTEHN